MGDIAIGLELFSLNPRWMPDNSLKKDVLFCAIGTIPAIVKQQKATPQTTRFQALPKNCAKKVFFVTYILPKMDDV